MNRTNLILLVVLVAVVAIWAAQRDWAEEKTSGPAPRMFPELNKEAADRIEMSGGWIDDTVVIERVGSEWQLASAGGFPAQTEKAVNFIDAVWNLRRENLAGTSAAVSGETRTDEAGRLVRILKGDTPMAAFRVGKSPKGFESQFVFIRPEGEDSVYRTRTILSKDQDQEVVPSAGGFPGAGGGPRGFDWHNNVLKVAQQWTESKLWELGDLETQELWLTRRDLDVKLVKKGQDVWEVHADEKTYPGDVDAANSLTSQLKWLYHAGVAGRSDDVAKDLGLDTPEITLVMTFRKKIEKKEEEKQEGDGKGDDEEKKEPEEEYEIVKRTLEVGQKLSRPRDRDDKTGEVETEEVYPIRIGGEFDDPALEKLAQYVFFVSDYRIGPLRKNLEELIQKQEEGAEDEGGDETPDETDGGDADEGEGGDKGSDDGESEKKDDAPVDPKKADDTPAEPKKADDPPAEPKKDDDPAEPKKDDG